MTAGPLRRVVAAIGLVSLVPIAAMLVRGALTPEEAAQRAVVVGIVVIVLGRLARRVVWSCLARVERRTAHRAGLDVDEQVVGEPSWGTRAAS